jgi:hypothetical protein
MYHLEILSRFRHYFLGLEFQNHHLHWDKCQHHRRIHLTVLNHHLNLLHHHQ